MKNRKFRWETKFGLGILIFVFFIVSLILPSISMADEDAIGEASAADVVDRSVSGQGTPAQGVEAATGERITDIEGSVEEIAAAVAAIAAASAPLPTLQHE